MLLGGRMPTVSELRCVERRQLENGLGLGLGRLLLLGLLGRRLGLVNNGAGLLGHRSEICVLHSL